MVYFLLYPKLMKLIEENSEALLWEVEHGFEIWIKIIGKYGKFKDRVLEPSDGDFGVWAWTTFTLASARKIYEEITSGERKVRPMTWIF